THEFRRGEGDLVFHPGRETAGELRYPFLYGRGGTQRIRPGFQENADRYRGGVVETTDKGVTLLAEFHPSYVTEAQGTAIREYPQQYILELLYIGKTPGSDDLEGFWTVRIGCGRQATRAELRILCTNGSLHIPWSNIVTRHLVGLEQDTNHIVQLSEKNGLPNARHPLELIDDIHQCVIAHIGGIIGLVRRVQHHQFEDVGRALLYLDTGAGHHAR